MSIADILAQFSGNPADTHATFDAVARQAPPEQLGQGLAEAFRSDQTPSFGNMVGSLFGNSNPQQQAGLLGQLLSAVGPGVLSGLAGGALGHLLQGGAGGAVSPNAAAQVTPEQAQEIAAAAQKQDPSILDRVGAYYAQHPDVVKVLGGAALAVALGHMASRNQQ